MPCGTQGSDAGKNVGGSNLKPRDQKNPIYDGSYNQPVNSGARRVLGGGAHWKPKTGVDKTFVREEVGTLPTRPVPLATKPHDLTGKTFGQLTVKGLGLKKKGNASAAWVVRCSCGAWEHRKSKALTNPGDPALLACRDCCAMIEIRRGNRPARL